MKRHVGVMMLGFTAALAAVVLSATGCAVFDPAVAASLGGDTAGTRGSVRVLFINNTPYRALLTAGTYDPADQTTEPDFVQFSADPTIGTLAGNAQSRILTIDCGRRFAVGSAGLLAAIERNLPDANADEDALLNGVGFSAAAADEDDAGEATEGLAPPVEFTIGEDFICNSLLIVRLEIDDAGDDPFVVDFSYVPSESSR